MTKKTFRRNHAVAPLQEVLAYENEAVVRKFVERLNVSLEDARVVFDDTKRWLWLCADQRLKLIEAGDPDATAPPVIDRSLFILDEMWHTFILFTKDYTDFCEKYFVFYIHHQPTTYETRSRRNESFRQDFDGSLDSFMHDLKHQMSVVYDAFGADTLKRWYEEYPLKFTPETVQIPLSQAAETWG